MRVQSGLVAAWFELDEHGSLRFVLLVRIVDLRVEGDQNDVVLGDVFQNFGKASFLIGFRPVHQAVIVVWHAVFKFSDEARVAKEDRLSGNFEVLWRCVLFFGHHRAKEVLRAQQDHIYFLENLEVNIDDAFVTRLTRQQSCDVIGLDRLIHVLEDLAYVKRV